MGQMPSVPISVLDALPDGDVHYGYALGSIGGKLDRPDAPNPVRFVCALGGQHFVIPAADLERYRKTSGDVVAVDPASLIDKID